MCEAGGLARGRGRCSAEEAEEVATFIRNIGQRAVIVRGDLSEIDVPDRLVAEASAGLGGPALPSRACASAVGARLRSGRPRGRRPCAGSPAG